MGFLRTLIEHGLPALSMSAAAAPAAADEFHEILSEFREKRAEDLASFADRAGRSGVRLASMERDRDAWKAYAKQLERLCLPEGVEMPRAPDEMPFD